MKQNLNILIRKNEKSFEFIKWLISVGFNANITENNDTFKIDAEKEIEIFTEQPE